MFQITLVYLITSVNQVSSAFTFSSFLLLYLVLVITMYQSALYNIKFITMRLEYIEWVQRLRSATHSINSPQPSPELTSSHSSSVSAVVSTRYLHETNWTRRSSDETSENTTTEASLQSATSENHFTEFFAALSNKVAVLRHIQYLIVFYFFCEIVVVRLGFMLIFNLSAAAAIIQMLIEMVTFSWLCYALSSRSATRSSAATELLQQVRRYIYNS